MRVRVAVELGQLSPDDVRVELLLTQELPAGTFLRPPLTSFGAEPGRSTTRQGKSIRFAATGVRSMGRGAAGVIGMRMEGNDRIALLHDRTLIHRGECI